MHMLRSLIAVLLLVSSGLAQQLSYDKYVEELAEKVRFKDEKGFDRLVKNNVPHVFADVRAHTRKLARIPDDAEVQAAMRRLEESWARVFETDTLDHVVRWVQSVDDEDYRKYEVAVSTLNRGINEFQRLKSENSSDRAKFEKLRDGFMEIAEQLEFMGEKAQAATAWNMVATVYGAMPNPTLIEKQDAVFASQRFLDLREGWAYTTDQHYVLTSNWVKHEREKLEVAKQEQEKRVAEGYDEDIKGIESYLTVDADANEKVVPLEFRILGKPNEVDVSFQGGLSPIRWPSVVVNKTGPALIPGFRATDLFLARPKGNRFIVTLDGVEADFKKNTGEIVAAASKIKKPSVFHLDGLGGERQYAMWFYTPSASEPFQGMTQNFEPTYDRATVYFKSASSWVADVDGTPLTFYDDNSDGKILTEDFFADVELKLRAITNTPDEHAQIANFDGMRVGKKGRVVPYSQWVRIDDKWWHLRPKDEGKSIGLRPTNPDYFKTGKLAVAWGGGKTELDLLVVQGRGWFEHARFEISAGEVEVPAGDYVVQYGRISQGKGARLIGADLLPGSMEALHVEPGKTTTVELGAPFRLDFDRQGDGRDLKIDGKSIRVVGRGGEVYRRVNGATPSPVILAAKDADGRGAKEIGEFERIASVDLFGEVTKDTALGFELAYYPLVKGAKTTVFEGFVDEDLLIGLEEDKNKLFGKLLPTFK